MSERRIDMLRKTQPSALNPQPSPLGIQSSFFIAAFVSVVLAAMLCAAGKYKEAAAASASILAVAFILSARISIESVLITWFVTTPLAYFYIRFPVDKSILTYDRAVFALVILMLLWKHRRTLAGRASALIATKFEIVWALLSVLALASAIMKSDDVAFAIKIAVDSFFLPLAAFHLVRYHFDARGRANLLMLGAMLLALFLFITGAFELATGTNLFQYKGSTLIREGEIRVNGPFAADSSYTIICLMVAVFLQAAPRLLRMRMDRVARLLYALALGAAMGATLLPMFRATAIALVICWMILKWATGRESKTEIRDNSEKAQRFTSSLWPYVLIGGAIAVLIFGPFSIGRRITDPRNAFGRLATWEAAAGIAMERPLSGVGLTNYRDYFHAKYNWEDESVETVQRASAADSPHSNPLWIAAELGLVALALYLMASLYLFFMGLSAMKKASGPQQRAAAACYLALMAAYWIPGLTLASGYYSDLNLYFFFMLGLLLNKSLTASPASINGLNRESEF
jgi:O-antigen ligase